MKKPKILKNLCYAPMKDSTPKRRTKMSEGRIRQILANTPDKDKVRKVINYIKENYTSQTKVLSKKDILNIIKHIW
jgi:hypothetical protein